MMIRDYRRLISYLYDTGPRRGYKKKNNETHKNKEINILINFDKVIEEITQLHKGAIHNCREFLTIQTRY